MQQSVHEEYRALRDHWWFRARQHIFARLLDSLVALPTNARILDVGPGSGINLALLSSRGEVTVADIDRRSLESCRAAGAQHLVRADATDLPLAEGCFDLVTALDVLEHLADDGAALRGIHRSLKPGGTLLLSVPALRWLWGRQDVTAHHLRRYHRAELRAGLLAAGFRIERLTYFNSLLLPPIALVRLLMRPFLARSAGGGRSDLSVRAPLGLDRALHALFASEARWLRRRDLPLGVSLLALARRPADSAAPAVGSTDGSIDRQQLAADPFQGAPRQQTELPDP